MFKIVCALLMLLILLPAIVYSYSRVQRARKRRAVRPLRKGSAVGPIVTAGEVPPSESGKWRVEPIMQILREAKAKKEQSDLSEEPIAAPPAEPGV